MTPNRADKCARGGSARLRWGMMALAGVAAGLSACAQTDGPSASRHSDGGDMAGMAHQAMVADGAEAGVDPVSDDLAYLTQLALIRGHLHVGVALHNAGFTDHAMTHMKHPADELYAQLQPAFVARGVAGFADGLVALSHSVAVPVTSADFDSDAFAATYDGLLDAVSVSEQEGILVEPTAALDLRVAQALVAEAAEEYAIGVVEGQIANVHEYQDAYGFVRVASQILRVVIEAPTASVEHRVAAQRVVAGLNGIQDLWPELAPAHGAAIGTSAGRLQSLATAMADVIG